MARGTRTPSGGPNSFDFMQFLENLAKSYVGAPPSGELTPLDPGSATVDIRRLKHKEVNFEVTHQDNQILSKCLLNRSMFSNNLDDLQM